MKIRCARQAEAILPLVQSLVLRVVNSWRGVSLARQRLGVRQPSAAFDSRRFENCNGEGCNGILISPSFGGSPSKRRRKAAFTLIELVISGSLMAIVMIGAYACLSACLESQKAIEPRVEIMQNARVALSLLTADLRSACSLSSEAEFVGMQRTLGEISADNLDFATRNYTPRRAREGDYCQLSYFVDRDRETGQYALFRRRNPTIGLDPYSGGSREMIATGILGVRFEYYDGLDWYDNWGDPDARRKQQFSLRERTNLSGLPEAVRVTLMFDSNPKPGKAGSEETPASEKEKAPPPQIFQTVVRLNLAAVVRSNSSSSSTTSGDDGGAQQAPPTPGPQQGGN